MQRGSLSITITRLLGAYNNQVLNVWIQQQVLVIIIKLTCPYQRQVVVHRTLMP